MNSPRSPPSSYIVPLYDTTALTSALANPYAQYHAPHYHQAYLQACSSHPRTTEDGYTLSSTYVPGRENQRSRAAPLPAPPPAPPSAQAHSHPPVKPILNHLTHGIWYQPGDCRCIRRGCPFTGSRTSVEIHMMDRHFIFPPGWEKKDGWDADPSLRGKRIAIQGTSIILDTQDAVNAWIAERKRRFPTDEKVQDKKRKLEEAAARGQLTPSDIGAGARKRQKQSRPVEGNSRPQGYQKGGGCQWRGLVRRKESRTQNAGGSTSQAPCRETGSNSGSTSDDDTPEVVSSKALTLPPSPPNIDEGRNKPFQRSHASLEGRIKKASLPKKPSRNPFLSRPTLLRNLLLPEIQVTISNLSQAIHFLVENDFFRNVELQPGEAQERMIEVLEPGETSTSKISNGV